MTARYSAGVSLCQTLPCLWLISDARNDSRLAQTLRSLPRGSGFVFRHYHLDDSAREHRFAELAAIARGCGHLVVLSGDPGAALQWQADGIYASAEALPSAPHLLRLATAHDAEEIEAANRARADGVFLSPVFATRSHPGAATLGAARFRMLAAKATMPVIALGGMDAVRARALDWPRWAAVDGLVLPQDS